MDDQLLALRDRLIAGAMVMTPIGALAGHISQACLAILIQDRIALTSHVAAAVGSAIDETIRMRAEAARAAKA